MDARRGFEPRLLGSEPSVLPLDERAEIAEPFCDKPFAVAQVESVFDLTNLLSRISQWFSGQNTIWYPSGDSNSKPSEPKSDASASWARGAKCTGDNINDLCSYHRDGQARTSAVFLVVREGIEPP